MNLPPSFSVIVSSYNYQDHVVDAVDSALQQTVPPLEVVVVDDGSTDDSLARLHARFDGDARVRIIAQANAGQLAAWLRGLRDCSGDVIALLDSDDLWLPNFIETLGQVYQARPDVDYVYCNLALFGAREGLMLDRRRHRHDRDLGLSVVLGCFAPRWQGVATSGNTVRRALFQRILALPDDQISQWRTRPDDCLFYGADVLGGHKFYLAQALARHREHGRNALLADRSATARLRYEIRRERLLAHYRRQIDASPRLLTLAKSEFRTKPRPLWSDWRAYCGLAWTAPEGLLRRLGKLAAITAYMLRSRR
ncbi:MAG: glycosyltransferase family A protein [Aquabacterium sp.]|nr:glycosyltransferase family A protein [Aquabacterium sp.]